VKNKNLIYFTATNYNKEFALSLLKVKIIKIKLVTIIFFKNTHTGKPPPLPHTQAHTSIPGINTQLPYLHLTSHPNIQLLQHTYPHTPKHNIIV